MKHYARSVTSPCVMQGHAWALTHLLQLLPQRRALLGVPVHDHQPLRRQQPRAGLQQPRQVDEVVAVTGGWSMNV